MLPVVLCVLGNTFMFFAGGALIHFWYYRSPQTAEHWKHQPRRFVPKDEMRRMLPLVLTNCLIISTMLGLFNLLPMPALDGGRLVFLGWEMITRRPVNQRVEQVVHAIGMVLLLMLVAFLLVRGLWRQFG